MVEPDCQRQFTISRAKSLAGGGASRYHGAPWKSFLSQVINGLQRGSIYALIALGYTMVYGVLQLINFAHGEVFMIGAFVGYFAALLFGAEPAGGAAGGDGRLRPAGRGDGGGGLPPAAIPAAALHADRRDRASRSS